MNRVVRNFKYNILEGRFVPFVVSLMVVMMRLGLYLSESKSAVVPSHESSLLWKYLAPYFSNPFVSLVSSTLFIFIIAWFISHFNYKFSLIKTRTNLPFIIPIVLFSLHPYFLEMSPDLIAVSFVFAALTPLLSSYQQYEPQLFAFESVILLCIASLFQLYALLLIPLWWKGEFLMRGFKLKSLIASFLGILLISWILIAVYMFFGNLMGVAAPFAFLLNNSLQEFKFFQSELYNFISIVVIVLAIYLIPIMNISSRDKVLTQKTLNFLIYIFFISLVFHFLFWKISLFWIALMLVLVSFLSAYFFSLIDSKIKVYAFYTIAIVLFFIYFINYFSFLPSSL